MILSSQVILYPQYFSDRYEPLVTFTSSHGINTYIWRASFTYIGIPSKNNARCTALRFSGVDRIKHRRNNIIKNILSFIVLVRYKIVWNKIVLDEFARRRYPMCEYTEQDWFYFGLNREVKDPKIWSGSTDQCVI